MRKHGLATFWTAIVSVIVMGVVSMTHLGGGGSVETFIIGYLAGAAAGLLSALAAFPPPRKDRPC